MNYFEGDITKVYKDAVSALLNTSDNIVKDGKRIKEKYNSVFKIESPSNSIITSRGRNYNPAFMVAETIWNLSGSTSNWLCNYNYKYFEYFDGSKHLLSGYGNRIFNWDNGGLDQFHKVYLLLKENQSSQHGNITIFNPKFDLEGAKFVPCITGMKFRIRDGKLYMSTFMRAQDIWIGFPYDIHLMISFFLKMAKKLNLALGDYYHYCDVIRLYEENIDSASLALLTEGSTQCNKIEYHDKLICKDTIAFIEDPEKLYYENLIGGNSYVNNCILVLASYKRLRNGQIKESENIIEKVSNHWREQYYSWRKEYYKF